MSERQALFISHASPEDNAFTIWLGAKLAAAGYEVWADVLRLTGGDDWQRRLEDALRNRACKVQGKDARRTDGLGNDARKTFLLTATQRLLIKKFDTRC